MEAATGHGSCIPAGERPWGVGATGRGRSAPPGEAAGERRVWRQRRKLSQQRPTATSRDGTPPPAPTEPHSGTQRIPHPASRIPHPTSHPEPAPTREGHGFTAPAPARVEVGRWWHPPPGPGSKNLPIFANLKKNRFQPKQGGSGGQEAGGRRGRRETRPAQREEGTCWHQSPCVPSTAHLAPSCKKRPPLAVLPLVPRVSPATATPLSPLRGLTHRPTRISSPSGCCDK